MHSEEAKVYIALLIAAGILAIILILFILATLQQQRKHRQLQKEKINAEIKTLENERRRVARDLHDEVAALFAIARLKLSSIEETDEEKNVFLKGACAHIDDGLEKIRDIAKDLMPITLERKGLSQALEELFCKVEEANRIQVDRLIADAGVTFDKNIQIQIYRVIQEIIHNSLKHATATRIIFRLEVKDKYIKIVIADNGRGFNQLKVVKEHNGLGLHNIFSRIEMLNGDMYLETGEGKGVSYTLEIPLILTV